MAALTATRNVETSEGVRAEARALVTKLGDAEPMCLALRTDQGHVELPESLSTYLLSILQQVAAGAVVNTQSLPEELTTTTAARLLGISRPTLMKLVARGDLAAYKVGSHTRLKAADVFKFSASRQAARREALADMMRLDDEYPEEGESR